MYQNFYTPHDLLPRNIFVSLMDIYKRGLDPSRNPMYVHWENPDLSAPVGAVTGPTGWYRIIGISHVRPATPEDVVLIEVVVDAVVRTGVWVDGDHVEARSFFVTDSFAQGKDQVLVQVIDGDDEL